MKRLIILALAAFAAMTACKQNPAVQEPAKKELKPTTVAILPMEPGQKSFGLENVVSQDTLQNGLGKWNFNELCMSDPYIYADPISKTYYLTSTGGRLYKSKDLITWEGSYAVADLSGSVYEGADFCAAAEIHKVGDYYYYAGTFGTDELVDVVPRRGNVKRNQTILLRSDKPEGPYTWFEDTPDFDFQPRNWACIDGTLFEDNGHIYFVFVHGWDQIIDGTMDYVELSKDLKKVISEEPVTLFRASENPSVGEMTAIGETTFGLQMGGWVTDGPELFRTQTGKLGMLWASWGKDRYEQLVCYSESGTIDGPWIQEPEPFLANNSGHGMLFRTFDGKLLYLVHHQEGIHGPRKPQLWEVDDSGDKLVLIQQLKF